MDLEIDYQWLAGITREKTTLLEAEPSQASTMRYTELWEIQGTEEYGKEHVKLHNIEASSKSRLWGTLQIQKGRVFKKQVQGKRRWRGYL